MDNGAMSTDELQARITDLQRQLADTQEAWRKDGLRMAREIEQYRLALRYIAGEDIPGWEGHQPPEDVALDALIGAPTLRHEQ